MSVDMSFGELNPPGDWGLIGSLIESIGFAANGADLVSSGACYACTTDGLVSGTGFTTASSLNENRLTMVPITSSADFICFTL